jgi:hypothetical protein
MLRIYPVVLEVLKQLQPTLRQIERKDRDLARQLKRCSSSVALNLAEGMDSRGRSRVRIVSRAPKPRPRIRLGPGSRSTETATAPRHQSSLWLGGHLGQPWRHGRAERNLRNCL